MPEPTTDELAALITEKASQIVADAVRQLALTSQQPAVVASESGRNSITLKMLASGQIQWECHWYQTGDDPYKFVQDSFFITDQVAAFLHNHKPGEPLALNLERIQK